MRDTALITVIEVISV